MIETPKEKFLRNHQENMGIMRAALVKAIREKRHDDYERIKAMIETWERIADRARGTL